MAVEQLAEGWAAAVINDEAIPFLIPCKLGKDVRKVLQQLGTLGRRQRPDRIFNLLRGAHPPNLTVYFQPGNRAVNKSDIIRLRQES